MTGRALLAVTVAVLVAGCGASRPAPPTDAEFWQMYQQRRGYVDYADRNEAERSIVRYAHVYCDAKTAGRDLRTIGSADLDLVLAQDLAVEVWCP